ncbi:16S rRNA (uracil(1498)-N(3))-methyltransferase [Sporosalibacterium faouarense]|uniref:16S rRNA (uracil(1498)-N(3))-methyltransferase n=1 Tax=Sporosalibacterium faouarense TaxID=516123 RepID=UPI00192BE469|nr:16S rRNA (uracil(1498)-N(3))-methyltransferase [Sporosalibacterium faouarense]
MHRFFIDSDNVHESQVVITGDDVKHIKNVLRLNVGDKIMVCDGESNDYLIEIENIESNQVIGKIINKERSKGEPPIDVVLYQGLPKSTKMDLIIQKATELGVKRIVPVITERTVVKIDNPKKENKKLERWNRIALEASKQCKRGQIPNVEGVINFKEMVEEIKEDFVIVPYENEIKIGTKEILSKFNDKTISIVIGPEGGFEEEEIEKLKEIGANIITLGPRILRTETAGFTTMAIVMYELGDLGVI